MNLDQRISAFSVWGNSLHKVLKKMEGELVALSLPEEKFEATINIAKSYNGWFSKESVVLSCKGILQFLSKVELEKFVRPYRNKMKEGVGKTVLIVMAGNIPMVGFHDLFCVLLSGNKALVKLSSDDNKLLPALCEMLIAIDPSFSDKIEFIERPSKNFEVVIATGNDNSTRYFEYYFGKFPHVFRKNRFSIAVLNGQETEEQLKEFSKDIFLYYGLGCRNVSKIFVPKGYQFKTLIETFIVQLPYLENNKYQNNLEYQKAVMLLNKDPFIDAGFFFMKENTSPFSSIAVLHYEQYENSKVIADFITEYQDKIQCVVGNYPQALHFGKAQFPELNDFADGVDTMKFLLSL